MEVDERNLPLHREPQADVIDVARIRSSISIPKQAIVTKGVIVRASFTLDDRDRRDAEGDLAAKARLENPLGPMSGTRWPFVVKATFQGFARECAVLGNEPRLLLQELN